jgi:glycosyltransferase involved in cell wall biosynthesis
MRVCLFTDTLGDINGVSRFIRNAGDAGAASGCLLTVLTSTRMEVPDKPHFVNVRPIAAMRMPRYEHLEVVLPRAGEIRRVATALKPDAIHVSTPGPVGMVGRGLALKLGVPLLGTYHTDFPAYVERLFDDTVLGSMTADVMAWFYRPFSRVFSRSAESMRSMADAGLDPGRFVTLNAGMDTEMFHPRCRDESLWERLGASMSGTLRVLSCGRVSIEKNLPMLVQAWKLARPLLRAQGTRAQLVVVGDGPYLAAMKAALAEEGPNEPPPLFLGFRHGAELSSLYASSDFFVFPSTTDTLGQAVMEAQASGLPALVSDQGGPKGIIEPGRTGLVLSGSDPAAWARAIAELAADPSRRAEMSDAAHLRMQNYGFAKSFEHFWKVHEQAVAESVHSQG